MQTISYPVKAPENNSIARQGWQPAGAARYSVRGALAR
jgi:hypothetical protein